jgi:NAD(P)H-hydrate epimerase
MPIEKSPRWPKRGPASLTAVNSEEMRRVDRQAMDVYGIDLLQMMELAGRSLALMALEIVRNARAGGRVLVLAGPGNNGGGGMVAARHLMGWGCDVGIGLAVEKGRLKSAPEHQWSILQKLRAAQVDVGPSSAGPPALVIDALFGYGFHGQPDTASGHWIRWANAQACPILSLDMPSGLDATTGSHSEPCIRAARTLTLAAPKKGLWAADAQSFVGEVWLADIGIPSQVFCDLGLGAGPVFSNGPIVLLSE